MVLAQRLGGVADLALARQEDQDVAGAEPRQFIGGIENGSYIALGITFASSPLGGGLGITSDLPACGLSRVASSSIRGPASPAWLALSPSPSPACGRGEHVLTFDRPPADLHRIQSPRHLDHRRIVEVLGEALGIDGRRSDDQAQVAALQHQRLQITEQEIDVEAALVRLVDDDGVVAAQ
jgi:hypothetical protein